MGVVSWWFGGKSQSDCAANTPRMEQITVRIPADVLDELEAEADEHDRSRSEHVRDVIDSRNDPDADVERLRERIAELEATRDELQDAVDDLERDAERLQNEKRLILEDREEKQELVRYVEAERTEQQRWRQAGLTTRLKWRITGMPGDGGGEE